jgi:hypothetical protein
MKSYGNVIVLFSLESIIIALKHNLYHMHINFNKINEWR